MGDTVGKLTSGFCIQPDIFAEMGFGDFRSQARAMNDDKPSLASLEEESALFNLQSLESEAPPPVSFVTSSSALGHADEIKTYHEQAKRFSQQGKILEAIDTYEKGLALARLSPDKSQCISLSHDYILACLSRQKWSKFFDTLSDLNRMYQDMDCVEEKIQSLVQLSVASRIFGDLEQSGRLLKLASNLNQIFDDFSLEHRLYYGISVEMAHAVLEKKSGHYLKSIESCLRLQNRLKKEISPLLDEQHRELYKIQTDLILSDCYLELNYREKFSVTLGHLDKSLKKSPNLVLRYKYEVLQSQYKFIYEGTVLNNEEWLDFFKSLYAYGELEFCLEQYLRVLREYHKSQPVSSYEPLLNYYQELIKISDRKIPKDFRNTFHAYYEFKPMAAFQASAHHLMVKLAEMCRELMSERDTSVLAKKSLDYLLDATGMERGFLLTANNDQLDVCTVHQFKARSLTDIQDDSHECYQIAQTVFHNSSPYVRTDVLFNDLASLEKTHEKNLSQINRRSYFILPLINNNSRIGVFYLDSLKSRSPIRKESDFEILESLVTVIAVALDNANHFSAKDWDLHQAKRKIAEQKTDLAHRYSTHQFIGVSKKIKETFALLSKATESQVTVTITGESGVGKEMVAKIIHHDSGRQNGKFVAINCAAIPENLLESELFGYVAGAFTGAAQNKKGLIEEAHQGTLLLDEIGEMPLGLQVKLLRFLEEHEVQPIGAKVPVKVDVRVICATNKNLEALAKAGRFREDLLYRINVIRFHIPSLRERPEDIPLMVDHALKLYAKENLVAPKTISSQALNFLIRYSWPGNVRELINVMYNLSIFVDRPRIELSDLEQRRELFHTPSSEETATQDSTDTSDTLMDILSQKIDAHELSLADAKHEFERLQIDRALKLYNGQITNASYHLQMPRPQVSRLVKKYGLKKLENEEDSDANDDSLETESSTTESLIDLS